MKHIEAPDSRGFLLENLLFKKASLLDTGQGMLMLGLTSLSVKHPVDNGAHTSQWLITCNGLVRKGSLCAFNEKDHTMFKIAGLDKLQKDLEEAQRALGDLDGELGVVHFDPHDPSSIEDAIQSTYRMIGERVGRYESNPIIRPLIEQLKEEYRQNILTKAATSRINSGENK